MPQTQSLGTPRITGRDLNDLQQSTQFWMQQVFNHLDRMAGLRGTPTLYSDLDANGKKLTNVASAENDSDVVTRQQTLVLSMNPEKGQMQFDAQGTGIFNGADADHPTDFVTLQQMVQAILDALSAAGVNASFVTVNAEPLLTNERQAAVEATVLALTDNGAGSTLVWSVAANGITDAKLRQSGATSVVGRSANSTGNVADIAASANGQVLRRKTNVLGFGAVDLSDGTNAVENVLGIANGGGLAGAYTPTLTNVANLDASTVYECQYMRVGNTVTVSGRVDIDPTLAATSTQLGISLPVASNLGATEDCAGVAFASGIAGQGAAILGDAANNRAQLQYISGDITNQAMYFTFAYQVI